MKFSGIAAAPSARTTVSSMACVTFVFMFVFLIQSKFFCVLENSLFVCTMMANLLLVVVAIDEVIKRPLAEIQCVLIAMV